MPTSISAHYPAFEKRETTASGILRGEIMRNKQVLNCFFSKEHFCDMSLSEAKFYLKKTLTFCRDCLNQPTCTRTTDPDGFCDKGEPRIYGDN